jgi:hypothetical protein
VKPVTLLRVPGRSSASPIDCLAIGPSSVTSFLGGGALRPGDGPSWADAEEMAGVLTGLEGLTHPGTTDQWEADGDSFFTWQSESGSWAYTYRRAEGVSFSF